MLNSHKVTDHVILAWLSDACRRQMPMKVLYDHGHFKAKNLEQWEREGLVVLYCFPALTAVGEYRVALDSQNILVAYHDASNCRDGWELNAAKNGEPYMYEFAVVVETPAKILELTERFIVAAVVSELKADTGLDWIDDN